MNKASDQLLEKVDRILTRSSIEAAVSVQGSFARDTWLSGETDLDIFTQFPPSTDRRDWIERVLPTIREGLARFKIVERYAEHPFLELHFRGIRVNIVPCYDVKKGEWRSATDRTPFHTEFMKANLTEEIRLEARLLRKFARGISVYGAEIRVGGFSGMLIDTLALHYRTFFKTISQASSWIPSTLIEIGKPPTLLEKSKAESGVELVVVDPVDPNRNLASAVRLDRLWTFVAAGRSLLQNPGVWYFFPPTPRQSTEGKLAKKIGTVDREILAVTFKHPMLVQDVLWGQLQKFESSLLNLVKRGGFQVTRAGIWSDDNNESAVFLEVESSILPTFRTQTGPPVAMREDSQSFLGRHLGAGDTVRGPWIQDDRWIVEKKRQDVGISDFIRKSLNEQSNGLAIPKLIGKSLSQSAKILSRDEIFVLLKKRGFAGWISEFLEAKPQWLKRAQ